jgi:hypothetical protein
MKLTFAQDRNRRLLLIDDAELIFKNFEGRGDRYNREGERNFAVKITDVETAEKLQNDTNQLGASWNVKIKPPRDEGDMPFMYLPVKVKFTGFGPQVVLITGNRKNELTEDTVHILDTIQIERVDLDVRAYDDQANGKAFRAAYLDKIYVTQKTDRFTDRYDM